MHILFPSSVLSPGEPDVDFVDQIGGFGSAGFSCSLCSIEEMEAGKTGLRDEIPVGSTVLYRGWMLSPHQYDLLLSRIAGAGCKPFVSREAYLAAHYLPNWYRFIEELTPRTKVFTDLGNIDLSELSGRKFFVKDFVKSLKTSVGPIVRNTRDIEAAVGEMIKFRGEIEGGICIREHEEFVPDSEVRYFVIHSIPYAADESDAIPRIVTECASRIPSPFFSIDVARRIDGADRIVEVGDGQVSDIVGWSAKRLADVLKSTLINSHICSH